MAYIEIQHKQNKTNRHIGDPGMGTSASPAVTVVLLEWSQLHMIKAIIYS